MNTALAAHLQPVPTNLSAAGHVVQAAPVFNNPLFMDTLILFRVYALLLLAGWIIVGLKSLRTLRSIRALPRGGNAGTNADLPSLSVVIPFRNEADTLERTVAPFLQPRLPVDVILVDDHSTDASGGIADGLTGYGNVAVVRPAEPPAGWLGKSWACHHGAKSAHGQYLLFMDADVEVDPSLLPDLLRELARTSPPHLVLFPYTRSRGVLETSYMVLFEFYFLLRFDPHAARRSGSGGHVGVGAFNLVRRDMYDRFGGYEALRLAVADDVMLGKRVKEAGGYTLTFHAGKAVRVRWREGFLDTLRATRRSLFAGTDFSLFWLLLAIGGTFGGILAPYALLTVHDPIVRIAAAAAAVISVILPTALRGRSARRFAAGLLFPLQSVIFLGVYLLSAADALMGRALHWRGRRYEPAMLRRWQRSRN